MSSCGTEYAIIICLVLIIISLVVFLGCSLGWSITKDSFRPAPLMDPPQPNPSNLSLAGAVIQPRARSDPSFDLNSKKLDVPNSMTAIRRLQAQSVTVPFGVEKSDSSNDYSDLHLKRHYEKMNTYDSSGGHISRMSVPTESRMDQ